MKPDHDGHEHGIIHPPRRRGILARLRANFLTGLVVVAPVGLTLWLIWTVTGWIDSWVLPFVPDQYQPDRFIKDILGEDTAINVRGVGVVVFLLFTVFVGWIAKGLIGRSLIGWGEGLVDRMPVVRSVYSGVKQVAETVFSQTESKFDKACLIEYPRPGIWAIGFVSTAAKGEILARLPDDEVMTVFLPTTPNPTSGFLLYVPKRDVSFLDMSVEDAAKLVISAGLVYPNGKDKDKEKPQIAAQ
ncbi:DUF502 domain-containing protein [Defluviimonas sp. WL0024]|uniref:DUF502 domain-containing protein n=2 Tax=Albidovulum TaxID=205889 RepID=A0ABT3J0A4_9RHOB|nr:MULTISPECIES: DUF502 domain-containing protein [Defluviimonas]MCU9846841.1 DUF502 domain-containing protein [Defluviimonas sp. WL0024]MCW3781100.1 DUF502 domain-containing protein [Defluviimonas salinarum]